VSLFRANDGATEKVTNYVETLAALDAETIARQSVRIEVGNANDWLYWMDGDGLQRRQIRKGMTPVQALCVIEAYRHGHRQGQDDGSEEMRREFRELLGVASDD